MQIITKNIRNIRKNKAVLEKKLGIKIDITGKKVMFEGDKVNEFISEKIILALDANFPIETALLLIDENYIFEQINIKNITKRRNLAEIRARIVGTRGRTLELFEELSECNVRLNDNIVSIIGSADKIKNCMNAVIKLIHGSKQSSVYSYLEKQKGLIHPGDLGLKEQ